MFNTLAKTSTAWHAKLSQVLSQVICAVAALLLLTPQAYAFKVYDATLYSDRPTASFGGITTLTVAYTGNLWNKGEDIQQLPKAEKIKDAVKNASPLFIIDIEHLHTVPSKTVSTKQAEEGLDKLREVLAKFKTASPQTKFGYYSMVPLRDYWRAIKGPGTKEYLAWQSENDSIKPLANDVDVVFPSLYAFYPDQKGWVTYARENIAEARRLAPGKQVIVFLWPQFHPSGKAGNPPFLPLEFWRLQLDTVRKHADGVVIWGGWDFVKNKQLAWDESAPWWEETKSFLKQDLNR
jgi:hypothetical protein